MTTQSPDRKTPEEIAKQLRLDLIKSWWRFKDFFNDSPEHVTIEFEKYVTDIIKQERASKPTLVLPKFDDLFIAVNESKKAESEAKYLYHWLHAEIARLNAPTVCEGKCDE